MIQRCPQCGQWIKADKDTIMDKAARGANDVSEIGGSLGEALGGLFGNSGKRLGRNLGSTAASFFGGGIGMVGNVLMGSSYHFCCPNCGYEWTCDNEEEDQTAEYNHEQQIGAVKDELWEIWTDNPNKDELRKFISETSEIIQQEGNARLLSMLYDWRSIAHWLLDQHNEAYQDISSSLRLADDAHSRAMRGVYTTDLAKLAGNSEAYIDAIRDLTSIYEENHQYTNFGEPLINMVMDHCIQEYVNAFVNLHPSRRKFICFTDKVQAMGNNILVLPLGKVPQGLIFPDGLPKKNVIYELHPFKPNHYVSLENFDYDMFHDKISEFKWILENLGARKIKLSIENGHTQNEYSKNKMGLSGEVGIKGVSGAGTFNRDSSAEKYQELRTSFDENNEFLPGIEPPHLPNMEKLIWYPHSEDWQKKVESRLSGRANAFEIAFSSHTTFSLSDQMATALEAEMKYLMSHGKVGVNIEKEYRINRTESQVWRISVEFYPLSVYQRKDTNTADVTISPIGLTPEEQNYLDTYKECLSDGTISSRERKLLDRISVQSGLSSSRVAELEAMVTPQNKKSFWKRLFS